MDDRVRTVMTLVVDVADARAWAQWIRGVRADIAERMDEGHIRPDLTAPEPVYATLLEVLEAIDALPVDQQSAHMHLSDDARLQELLDHLTKLQRWFDQLVDWGMVSHRRSEPAMRFHRHLATRSTA